MTGANSTASNADVVRPTLVGLFLSLVTLIACARPTAVIGVSLPLAGRHGADGLMALHGVQMAIDEVNAEPSHIRFTLQVRDTARGGFQNPHVDEGTDNIFEPDRGAKDIEAFGKD